MYFTSHPMHTKKGIVQLKGIKETCTCCTCFQVFTSTLCLILPSGGLLYRGGEAALTLPENFCFTSLLPSGILRNEASLGTTHPEKTNVTAMRNTTHGCVQSMAESGGVRRSHCSTVFYVSLSMSSIYVIIIFGDIKVHFM